MNQIHPCKDNSEIVTLHASKGLFLKPIARINVSVHYPELKNSLMTGGKSVSSWDIMERIKALVSPETFISLRVTKNTLEFIRFEGDLENRTILKTITGRLEGKTLKVTGFKELLKIRAAEAKLAFPSKYNWDSFFRDAKNMNEMKAGERPDTIHFQNLPCKWFSEDPLKEKPIPSEKLFRRVWDLFGEVRSVDIPMADPYRPKMTSSIGGIKTFSFNNDNVFEGYVQFRDYMSFVKAMDALRGCFLFYQNSDKYWVANIKVDFDKSKHLGEEAVRRRKSERGRLIEKEKQKKANEKLTRMEADVQEKKTLDKEKRESNKTMAKIEYKIALEERKYLIARRKLEAIRLMDYLFESVKQRIEKKTAKKKMMREKAKEENRKFEKEMQRYKELQTYKAEEEKKRFEKEMQRYKKSQTSKAEEENRKLEKEVQRYKETPQTSKVVQEKEERLKSLVVVNPSKDSKHETKDSVHKEAHVLPKTDTTDFPGEKKSSEGAYSSRYLGDWEVKGRSHGGSEVKVSSSYVPVEISNQVSYRGRGHFRGRGRGRGQTFPYPHSSNRDHHNYLDNNRSEHGFQHNVTTGPTVHHDFSYLEDLDRAYEKYFTSITNRHTETLESNHNRNEQ